MFTLHLAAEVPMRILYTGDGPAANQKIANLFFGIARTLKRIQMAICAVRREMLNYGH